MYIAICFFFFQAEDDIRYLTVTGVQTCALPIFLSQRPPRRAPVPAGGGRRDLLRPVLMVWPASPPAQVVDAALRSEERRVGKECSFCCSLMCCLFGYLYNVELTTILVVL